MGVWVPWLADAARLTGYPVVELPGWRTRGHGPMRVVEGVVGHHTACPLPGDYPSLTIVRDGRGDLAGPLANLGLGRSGTVYVIAAGLCYHAGSSTWAGCHDLNDEFIGIEAESCGTRDDWTAEQRDCYPRLVAALLHYMRRGADRFAFHREICVPRGRKMDAAYWDGPATRERIAWLLDDPMRRIPRLAAPTSWRDDDTVENHVIAGTGILKLVCPVGGPSLVTARARISAALADGTGKVQVWAQSDTGGIADWQWSLAMHDGRSDRPCRDLPDGTTQLMIHYQLTDSGVVCLETQPRS